MVASAIFYERDQSTPAQDVLASLVTSLLGTGPQRIIKMIFEKSKPKKKHTVSEILAETMKGGKCKVDMEKYQKVNAQRLELLEKMYSLPSCCREVGWLILLLTSMFAFISGVCTMISLRIFQ